MKVLILTTCHRALDVRIFHRQAKSLVKSGLDVTLIGRHPREEVLDGVKIIPLPEPRNRLERMFGLSLKALRLACNIEADIYHFHDPELIYVGLILKLLGKRVIYDVHEHYPGQILTKEWIPTILRKPASIFVGTIEYIVARIFDGIIAATDFIAERFPTQRTAIVRNFPSIDYFKELIDYSNSRNSLEMPVAIYAGGLSRIRGIRQIVEAFSYIRGVELWLVGEFEDQKFQMEIEQVAPMNVKILGFKSFREVINLYKRANLGLVCILPAPNYIDSLPTKLFEYMAAGLPVVASNFPLWRGLVDGCGILVNPEDPTDIAQAVKNIVDDPKALQKMGEEGQRKFMEIYNWEQESPRLLKIYKRIMESRRSA